MPQEKMTLEEFNRLEQEQSGKPAGSAAPAGGMSLEEFNRLAPPAAGPREPVKPGEYPAAFSPFVGAGKFTLGQGMGLLNLAIKGSERLPGIPQAFATGLRALTSSPASEIVRAGRPGAYPKPYTGYEKEEFWGPEVTPAITPTGFGEEAGSATLEALQLLAGGKPMTTATTAGGKLGARMFGEAITGPMGSAVKPGPARQAFELFTRAGVEAAGAGGQALASQREDPLSAAAWAAGFPVVGRGIGALGKLPGVREIPERFRRGATELMGGILSPRGGEEKVQAMRIAPKMLQQVTGPGSWKQAFQTRLGWAQRASKKMESHLKSRDLAISKYADAMPNKKLELDFDKIKARVDEYVKAELLTPGGMSKGPHANKAMEEIYARLDKMREHALSNAYANWKPGMPPPTGGSKMIDYVDVESLKTEWQNLLDEMGQFGKQKGTRIEDNPLQRALSIMDRSVREEIAEVAPDVAKFNKLASDEMLVMNPIDRAQVREWARAKSSSRPVVASGGGADMAKRMTTFLQYKLTLNVFDAMSRSAAFAVLGAQGLKAVGDAIERGEYDKAMGIMGRAFAFSGESFPYAEEVRKTFATTPEAGQLAPGGMVGPGGVERYTVPTPGGLENMKPNMNFDPNTGQFVPVP